MKGHYREIPEDRILKFDATPGFKGWEAFFTRESVSHPAKMNLNLLRWILKTYTESGDVVLDPMAGTGSTITLAALEGRNGVAVEYEPKFCDMIRENIELTKRQTTWKPKGQMACIQGDARELSQLLQESDIIITSPPYGNRFSDVAVHDGDPARMGYRQAVDVVLTSPPYSNSQLGGDNDEQRVIRIKEAIKRGDKISERTLKWLEAQLRGNKGHTQLDHERGYSEDSLNVGNLPHGNIDAVITSPPYGEALSGGGIAVKGYHGDKHSPTDLVGQRSYMPDKFEGQKNISRLPFGKIDTVITSPPYEGGPFDHAGGHGGKYAGGIAQRDSALKPITLEKENIGNMNGETYLEAMLQVYHECLNSLKPRGKMVLVVKNFIRDKSVVRLDLDTIKLCEAVGFRLIDHYYFRLPTKSFWRILYQQKYPDVPVVEFEDILIFEKPAGVPPKQRLER